MLYVDESGNPILDGTDRFFVLCGVSFDDGRAAEIAKVVDFIRTKFFNGDEIKGSSLGDTKRRLQILHEISDKPLKVFIFVIDKSTVLNPQDGDVVANKLKLIRFFLKRCSRFMGFSQSRIDGFGDKKDWPAYERVINDVKESDQQSLNIEHNHTLHESQNEIGIQLADLIANTVYKAEHDKEKDTILSTISGIISYIEHWPIMVSQIGTYGALSQETKFDLLTSTKCIEIAQQHAELRSHSKKPAEIAQVEVLHSLIAHARSVDFDTYLHADIIIDKLSLWRHDVSNNRAFMTKVIAPLRDMHVVIASSPLGYKLPTKTSDLYDLVKNVQSRTEPYLRRLSNTRNVIKSLTGGELDILDNPNSSKLQRIINALR